MSNTEVLPGPLTPEEWRFFCWKRKPNFTVINELPLEHWPEGILQAWLLHLCRDRMSSPIHQSTLQQRKEETYYCVSNFNFQKRTVYSHKWILLKTIDKELSYFDRDLVEAVIGAFAP